MLHCQLEQVLGMPVFLDTNDLDDLGHLLSDCVARSSSLILLQTADVLTRPWPLLELFTAVRHGVQIVPVLIEGKGYSFENARETLSDLPNQASL